MSKELNIDTKLGLLWWGGLFLISLINILIYLKILFNKENSHKAEGYSRKMKIFSGVYTLVCAYSSFFPRIDVERVCFWDTPFSFVFLGRSCATIAELLFIE